MKCGLTAVVQTLIIISAILSVIAFILQLVGFSTPNWLVGPGGGRSPFISIGWHSACFEDCIFPYCPAGDYTIIYDGCYKWSFNEWIWDDDRLKEIKEWLMPDWYNNVKIIVIVAIPVAFCGAAMLIMSAVLAFSERITTESYAKDVLSLILLYAASFFMLAAGTLIVAALAWFSLDCAREEFMPLPEKNTLGYSFWVTASAGIIYILTFVITFVGALYKSIRNNMEKDPRYSEDMMLGRD